MKRKLITFDWAIKRLLRSKANFGILEGFLSELLKQDITILDILESEGNKENEPDKFNRVDLKVRDSKQEIIIIEIQYDREYDYLQRIFYGVSKTAIEYMEQGQAYAKITKVISVNILYFDLGTGKDYIYKGSTRFIGLHQHDILELTDKQKKLFNQDNIESLYPEYYLIKINRFDDIAKDTLDEWIYFLKNEEIKDSFTAKGLKEAKEKLSVMKLSEEEQKAYDHYKEDLHYQASMFESSFGDGYGDGYKEGKDEGRIEGKKEGRVEGKAEGRVEGKAEGRIAGKAEGRVEGKAEGRIAGKAEGQREAIKQMVIAMEQKKYTIETIAEISGLTKTEIEKILS